MNNKANYKKGKRRIIVKLIYVCGFLPYSAIRMMGEDTRMYMRKIREMEKEGLLIVNGQKIKGDTIVSFKNYEKRKNEYEVYMPEGYREYYENIGYWDKKSLGNKETTQKRLVNMVEVYVMMMKSGVNVYPEDKPKIGDPKIEIPYGEAFYYNSREMKNAKRFVPLIEKYEVEKKDENGNVIDITEKNKTIMSRMIGSLVSPGGVYAVYDTDDSLMEWYKYGETKMAMYIAQVMNEKYKEYKEHQRRIVAEAIIMTSDVRIYQEIMMDEYKETDKSIMINIDYSYEQMYAVPKNEFGKKMIQIMKEEKWKERLIKSMLEDEDVMAAEVSNIACDACNGKSYILLYCIPDMSKLKQFIKASNVNRNNRKYLVYCFEEQLEQIAGMKTENIEIYSTPIDNYLEGEINEA